MRTLDILPRIVTLAMLVILAVYLLPARTLFAGEQAWQLNNYVTGNNTVGFNWIKVEGPNQDRTWSSWGPFSLGGVRSKTTDNYWWVSQVSVTGQLTNGNAINCTVMIAAWPWNPYTVSHAIGTDGSCSGWAR